jgi:subtilisin family serine protease
MMWNTAVGSPILSTTDGLILPSLHSHRRVRSFSDGWFLVRLLVALTSIQRHQLRIAEGIPLDTKNMVQAGWYHLYLTSTQGTFLTSSGIAELFSLPPKKIRHSGSSLYLVHATDKWSPPSGAFWRISGNLYVVPDLINLSSDPRILRITPHSRPLLLNRYSVGYLLDGNEYSVLDDAKFWNYRSLHKLGLTGSSQVVSVIDSGIDPYHCFFHDPKEPVPINVTNRNHRKIIRLDAIADAVDGHFGHGSHVCGIIAGKSLCQDCGISQYDGVAPGALLYMHDLGSLNISANDLGDVDVPFFLSRMRAVGSFIASNSWGFPSGEEEVRDLWSEAAFDNPDILFVFAGGNAGDELTINVPGNSKNVLTAGAASKPFGASIEDASKRTWFLGDTEIVQDYGSQLWPLFSTNPLRTISHRKLVRFGENSNENIVFVPLDEKNVSEFCSIIEGLVNHAAVVVDRPINATCGTKPIVRIRNSAKPKFGENVSIFPVVIGTPPPMGRALISSQGPSDLGYMKPEVLVPGSSINSATAGDPNVPQPRSCSTSEVHSKTGTSMAAPALSGWMTLVRQFFVDGWYPLCRPGSSTGIRPTSMLLRAVAANAAHSVTTEIAGGYGIPVLSEVLGFSDLGLAFVNHENIGSHEHHLYSVSVTTGGKPLSVTLSYLDPPLAAESSDPLFADLDLLVVAPTGRLFLGNGREDSFATTEKVVISGAAVGIYSIHVISSVFADVSTVPYSIVVNGGFRPKSPHELRRTEPQDCGFDCGDGICSRTFCSCPPTRIGVACGHVVQRITHSGKRITKVGFREIAYYQFVLRENSFKMQGSAKGVRNVVFCFGFAGHAFKISEPSALCAIWQDRFDFQLSNKDHPNISKGKTVFMAAYAVTAKNADLRFSIENLGSALPEYAVILILLGLFLLILFLVCVCCRKYRRRWLSGFGVEAETTLLRQEEGHKVAIEETTQEVAPNP